MSTSSIIESYQKHVVPSYARYPLVFVRGEGSCLWDTENRRYLDFGSGIAVTSLGHSHPALAETLARQAKTLIHTSNLYYTEPQAHLAAKINQGIGPGKCFFANSGAEANEALFKLARKTGHDSGRFEIITAHQSFHGRTLAGIAATGQDKVKKGFEPAVEGFRHIPYNDLAAAEKAITPQTAAILIEGIQGESGIHPATPEYLLGLRRLCDEKKILLFMDAVQDGMFRSGRFMSFQRILENHSSSSFLPDAISMAKGIAGGIPMGAVWIREPWADVFVPGTHATTFGGTPLASAAALTVFEVMEREKLGDNARQQGQYLMDQLRSLQSPHIREVRGLGLMIGMEINPEIPSLKVEGQTPSSRLVLLLHEAGLLTVPAGNQTIRLVPALNITRKDCDEAVGYIRQVLSKL